jgi:hypothetical protein
MSVPFITDIKMASGKDMNFITMLLQSKLDAETLRVMKAAGLAKAYHHTDEKDYMYDAETKRMDHIMVWKKDKKRKDEGRRLDLAEADKVLLGNIMAALYLAWDGMKQTGASTYSTNAK